MSSRFDVISKNRGFVNPSLRFSKSFLRHLLEGEVLDRSHHVAPSARLLEAAKRISLRRDACLTFPLKWYDTVLLILHIRLSRPTLLTFRRLTSTIVDVPHR